MTKGKFKIVATMFDIKPMDDSGNIDVSKISGLQTVLNLGRKFRINKSGGLVSSIKNQSVNKRKIEKTLIRDTKYLIPELDPRSEFERFFNKDIDTAVELASIGAEFHGEKYSKPRYKPITATKFNENEEIIPILASVDEPIEENYKNTLAQINLRIPVKSQGDLIGEPKRVDAFSLGILTLKAPQEAQGSKELDMWVKDFGNKTSDFASKISKFSRVRSLVIVGLFGLTVFGYYGLNIKNQLIVEGNSAVANIENAGENIKNMDFVSASNNFAQAYLEFSKAGDSMNFLGAGISSLLSDLPGAGKLKSAKNLVEAGKLMADAGQAMSDAMGEIAKTNLILNPFESVTGSDVSIGE